MRHISFDESTVMNELVRLANEKGLLKTAATTDLRGTPTQPAPQESKQAPAPQVNTKNEELTFLDALGYLPTAKDIYTGKKLFNPKEDMKSLGATYNSLKTEGLNKFLIKWLHDPATAAIYNKYVSKLVNSVKSYFGKAIGPQHLQDLGITQQMLSKSNADNSNVKNADNKIYDVSDETGEQLVEKAHPGGGTKTNVTNSKTKDNLVETIVEQQKADIEIVKKSPKGTYACLRDLHLKLVSLGHSDLLEDLNSLIPLTATGHDLMSDALVHLANRLDHNGYKKSATAVFDILKKADELTDADKKQMQYNAQLKEFGDKLAQTIALNLASHVGTDWGQKLVSKMQGATAGGYSVINAIKSDMQGPNGARISAAVNAAMSDPTVSQMKTNLDSASSGLVSQEPTQSAGKVEKKTSPAALKMHQKNLEQMASMIGVDPKSKLFWKRLQQLKVWAPGDNQKSSQVLKKLQQVANTIPLEWKPASQKPAAEPMAPTPPAPPPPPTQLVSPESLAPPAMPGPAMTSHKVGPQKSSSSPAEPRLQQNDKVLKEKTDEWKALMQEEHPGLPPRNWKKP